MKVLLALLFTMGLASCSTEFDATGQHIDLAVENVDERGLITGTLTNNTGAQIGSVVVKVGALDGVGDSGQWISPTIEKGRSVNFQGRVIGLDTEFRHLALGPFFRIEQAHFSLVNNVGDVTRIYVFFKFHPRPECGVRGLKVRYRIPTGFVDRDRLTRAFRTDEVIPTMSRKEKQSLIGNNRLVFHGPLYDFHQDGDFFEYWQYLTTAE